MARRPIVEAMEERVLHSADLAPLGLLPTPGVENHLQLVADAAAVEATHQLFVVDARATHHRLLADIAAADRRIDVVVIGPAEDAFARIDAELQQRSGLGGLHIVFAEDEGQPVLGAGVVDSTQLLARAAATAGWGDALATAASIDLHGGGAAARALGLELQALTGATVHWQPANAAAPPATAMLPTVSELVFIDLSIPDAELLIGDLLAQRAAGRPVEVIRIAADEDGLARIDEVLAGRSGITAVHVLSHGSDQALQIGKVRLDSAALVERAEAFKGWRTALTDDADLLFYGCDVAGSDDGQALLRQIAELTGADVAASADLTGHSAGGGNWVLEYQAGQIEAALAPSAVARLQWTGLLANYNADPSIADGLPGSLRAAINSANANPGLDTITLLAGSHDLTSVGLPEDLNAFGDLDITDSVTFVGAGAATTTVNAALLGNDRVFDVHSGSVRFQDLTITGGAGVTDGGGILVRASADVSLSNVVVSGNAASSGAGIHNLGSLTLEQVTLSDNTASGDGGGLRNAGSATLTDVWIKSNSASSGGGIYSQGSGSLSISKSTLSQNSASLDGGGLYASGGSLSIVNSTIASNTAAASGGGLYLASAGYSIANSTIAYNSAASGGGLFSNGVTVSIKSTILAANTGGNSNAAQLSQGYNLDTDNTAGLNLATDVHPASAGLVPAGSLAANGGYAPTLALVTGSAAINAGDPAAPALDQRGVGRYLAPDIGAYEQPNTAPTIGSIANQVTAEDTALGPIAFTVGDGESPAGLLNVLAVSSNLALLSSAGIVLGGSGSNRTLTLSPVANANGVVTVTVSVSDGELVTQTAFNLTITAVNDAPVITSNGGGASAALSVPENSTAVTTVVASDVDGDTPLYTISGGADAALFNINSSTGVLTFKVAPNWEAPSDAGADNVYNVTVRATDPFGAFASQALAITVTDVYGVPGQPSGVVWFSTTDSGSATGISFTSREVLQFGTADDHFDINGGATAGTLSKLPGFVAPEKIRGLHYVETTLTLGDGGSNNQFTLNPGDLLIAFHNDDVDLNGGDGNPYNDFRADEEDIVVFRPHVAGNYASGSWSMLLQDGVHRSGSDREVHAFTLVETDTMVGGTLLTAGTLLVAHEGGSEDSNIYTVRIRSTGLGSLTKTDDRQLLLLGSSLGISAKIEGLHLLTHPTAFNDTLLAKGTLLLGIDSSNTVAGTPITNLDIVALTVSKTQQDPVPGSVATSALLFDGSDIGLTSAVPRNFGGFTVSTTTAPTNTPPRITTAPLPVINENTSFVTNLAATDPEGGAISYSIAGGADRSLFSINGGNQLVFNAAPDFETPLDATTNNYYYVQVRATDGAGAAAEQLFVVRVVNVNEAPVANPDTGTATQDATRSVGAGTGVLANDSDVDAGDSKVVSAVAFGGTPGVVNSPLTGIYGTLTLKTDGSYTYLPSTAAAKALAKSQTAVETFSYTVRDAGGLTSSSTLTFTITGINDPVTTPVANLTTSVVESTTPPVGSLSNGNTISFADVDLNDVHTVSPTGVPSGSTLGSVTAVKNSDTTGTGTGGLLTWTYSVAASAVEYLAAGQTKNESFTLSIDDGNGSLITRIVTATITGTNDPVVITAETLTGSITEAVTPVGNLSTSAAIFFSDVDLTDVHLVSATGTPVGSVLGSLTAVKNSDTTGTGTGGKLTWTYTVAASALEYLAAGQTRVDSFTISINDQKGSLVTRQIDVTLTGSNDAIVINTQKLTGAVTELLTPSGNLVDTGAITFSDVDLNDVHTVTPTGTPVGSVLGSLTAVKNADTTGSGTGGQLTWTYTVAASAVEYLAAGQTKVESFDINIDDGNGSVLVRRIDVTITGSNDAPLITAEQLSGAVVELVTPVGSLSDSGAIEFSDVDLNDVHLVSPNGTPIGSVLGSLTAVKNSDTTGTGTGGRLTWTYTVAASAVEYLAAGQTRVDSFEITLNDQKGGLLTRRIDVTITGSNDDIVITAEQLTGAITEAVTPVGNLTDSGTIRFTDRDFNDVHVVSPTGAAIGSVLGSLTAVKNSDTTGTGLGGQLTWTYSVAASAVEYLAAGQTKVESFTISIDDQNGHIVTRQIDVTITGSNDAPVITAEQLSGAVAELVTPVGVLSDSGAIEFSDVDLNDVHLVSPNGTPIGSVLGSLTAVKNSDTTGSGTGGRLTWTYTVAASAVEYLAAGQTRVESFDVTLNDQNGGLLTKRIDVTITGSNDDIVITPEQLTGAITEAVTPVGNLTDSGTIRFTDRDFNDVHIVSPVGTPIGSVLGSLTAVKNADTTGTGAGGQLTWTYAVAASAVEYLAAGETKVERFTISIDDQNGHTVTRQIDVTITGSNDAPVITAEQLSGAVTELVTPVGNLSDSGVIEFIDVDLSDVHLVSPNGAPVGSVLGSLVAVKNSDTTGSGGGGRLSWTYTVAASAVEYLAAGQTRIESFDITLNDQNGGLLTKRIDVTITGSNDAIVITAEQLTGAITEAVTPLGNLTDSGTISFTDRDFNDVHIVSPVGTPVGTVLGSLTAVKNTDTTGTGIGGQLTWTYTVAATAVEYLAVGETRVESFTISIDDRNGHIVTRQIDVTITGTNDAIVISSEQLGGNVVESIAPAGNLTDSGVIRFIDVDLTDSHLVSPTGTPTGPVLGSLGIVKDSDTTGSGTGGQLTWTYAVAASAVEYLAAGQTKVERFDISIDDGNGSVLIKRIDVTITGSNDAPVITAEQLHGAVAELVAPVGNLSDGGTIEFSDVDLNDVHLVSPNGAPVGSVLGSLIAVKNSDTTGSGGGGRLSWTYTVAASAVEYLAAGQARIESFDITLDDQNGGLLTKRIDVTITGSNDDIVITAEQLTGAVTEAVTPLGNLTDSGTISFTDKDFNDVHLVSAAGTPIGSVLGSLSGVKNADTTGTGTGGQLTWTYTVAAGAVEYLAAGETKLESFTISIDDQNGSVVTRQIDVTITGTNDAPVITAEQLSGAVTELVNPVGNLSDSGVIEFIDVDLSDVHLVSPIGAPVGSVLGSMTAVKNSDTTGTGAGGRLTWTYTVAASAVEYLAAGQTRIESFDITLNDQNGGLLTKRIDVAITGSNDEIVITAEQLTGAITEAVTPVGNLSDSGTISFNDRDFNDVHIVSPNGTPIGSVLGSLTAVKNADTTGTGTGGQLTWTYTVAATAVEYLAVGETRVESFTISIDDQNGHIVTRQIDVTITGTNDAIVISSEQLGGNVVESITPAGNLTDSGVIRFIDVDLTDSHLVSPTGTPTGPVLGSLSVVKDSDTTGSGTGGQLTWTYAVAASAVEYLAAGQTKVERFTISIDDGNGSLLVRQIDVTITGSNDAPVITAEQLSGAVAERVAPVGNLSDSGSIDFSDVDLNDAHLVSPNGAPVGSVLGSLTAVRNSDTNGTGTGGRLTWTYTVAASAVEYLAAGQTRIESFDITLDDQNGGLLTKRIDVTITGSNDAILITSEQLIGAITEAVTPVGNLTDSGTLDFTDRDFNDVHIVSPVGTPIGSVLGSLTAVKNADTTGTGAGGHLTWIYTVAGSAVEYLAAGETKLESFTISIDDQNGHTVTRQIDVTITGSNDAPVITAEQLGGAVTELVNPVGNLSDSGVIEFIDVDLSDVHLVSPNGVPVGSVLGSLTAVQNSDTTGSGGGGRLTWTYTVAASAVEYLAAGQTKVESFDITLDDQNGGLLTKRIDVTITGGNDAIVIAAEQLTGAITEAVTPVGTLSDSGTISFNDKDFNDVHLVSPVGIPVGSVLGSLTALKDVDTTGTGTGGQLTWTYTVAASAVEYLAVGETRVESFTISVDDQNGHIVTRQIDVTIAGTNDAIVIDSEQLNGAVFNYEEVIGDLRTDGVIVYQDADRNDVHLASGVGTPIGSALGRLTVSQRVDPDASGSGGHLVWNYSVPSDDVDYLAAGELRVESFLIELNDGNGSIATRRIDITISGPNAAPVITSQTLNGVIVASTAADTIQQTDGLIRFNDVNLSDVHVVSPSGAPVGEVLGRLGAELLSDTTGTGTGGVLRWSYSVDAAAIRYLAVGESRVEQFDITLDDGHGGLVSRRIEVLIHGSNDAPVIVDARLSGAVVESADPADLLGDSGHLVYADADLSDAPGIRFDVRPVDGVLGRLTVVRDPAAADFADRGRLLWNYQVDSAAVVYLAADETRVDAFDVTITDPHGANVTRRIEVTMHGINNAPVVASEPLDQALTNGEGFRFVVPLPTFADADTADRLQFTATLEDGTPLPEWLKFDSERLTFSGTPPGGMARILSVNVVARDSSGAAAIATFKMHIEPRVVLAVDEVPLAPAARPVPVETVAAKPLQALVETRLELVAPPVAAEPPVEAATNDGIGTSLVVSRPVVQAGRSGLGSVADQVLAQALNPEFGSVEMSALLSSLQGGELLRRFDELQQQIQSLANGHQTAIASSIAVTTGLSVGYVVWLVRGGLLLSSLLSSMPAWQMIDPLPVLSSGRGAAGGADDDDDEDVERMFAKDRRVGAPARHAAPEPVLGQPPRA
ncbi:VCBS domain-containing protein [Piscinibacter sakaiensis]|uniref:VCBS domain-containing protein n=1 Tax=Piscinibacter sakaiensis TaxID=1547922 RepID=UPI003AAD880D